MNETPFFFENGSYNLFGVLHEPCGRSSGAGFVLCYPFAEEMLWAQRVFVSFARELARRGYAVLRFDFMGHGDSDGEFKESCVDTCLSDIAMAVRVLGEKSPGLLSVGLVGLRLGASLAALAAERYSGIDPLILWEPITRGHVYMQEILRANLAYQSILYKEIRYDRSALVEMLREGKTVNADGYDISRKMYEQVAGIELTAGQAAFPGRCLIVQIDGRECEMKRNMIELRGRYRNSDFLQVMEEPFWREIQTYYPRAENLFDKTIGWLEKA